MADIARIKRQDLFASLPPPWPDDPRPAIEAALTALGSTLVVLDDDPTGTQTLHGVHVLTHWSMEALQAELETSARAFFVLTNTRSMPLARAKAITCEVAQHIARAAGRCGRRFVIALRGDSTLRGHFPGELEALSLGLGQMPDGIILIPFFLEGGRFTVHDSHYAAEGEWLVPVAETPFARDSAFGYQHSNLRHWVAEKTGGRVQAGEVLSVSLADVRERGPERVRDLLMQLRGGRVCIVNATSMRDLEVFTQGLLEAEQAGKHFLFRTAASFVPVRAGIIERPPLTPDDLASPAHSGGLMIAGSHVPITTAQLNTLLQEAPVHGVQVQVPALLDDATRAEAMARAAQTLSAHLEAGEDALLYTSRALVEAATAEESLRVGQRVSSALVEITRMIQVRPRYLLVKGGITSSDIATEALGVKRAWAMGQILPGVPVWRLGEESRYPRLIYVIFPGNVGHEGSLVEAYSKLVGARG